MKNIFKKLCKYCKIRAVYSEYTALFMFYATCVVVIIFSTLV